MLTSSAYSTVLTCLGTTDLISLVSVDKYRAKSSGPEIEPCGTPRAKRTTLLYDFPTQTQYLLSMRNPRYQRRREVGIPMSCIVFNKIHGSTLSNAFSKSNNMTNKSLLPGVALVACRSLTKSNSGSSVDLHLRNPAWLCGSNCLLSTSSSNLVTTIRSINFPTHSSKLIGRYDSTNFGSLPDFNKGCSLANFHAVGTYPFAKERLISL